MAPRNPINGTTPPIAGRPLPADWQRQARAKALQAEAAYLDRLENAWKQPLRQSREGITARDARLCADSASHRGDSGDNGPEATIRMDGKMQLLGREGDWEIWRDSVSGATVRRRM